MDLNYLIIEQRTKDVSLQQYLEHLRLLQR